MRKVDWIKLFKIIHEQLDSNLKLCLKPTEEGLVWWVNTQVNIEIDFGVTTPCCTGGSPGEAVTKLWERLTKLPHGKRILVPGYLRDEFYQWDPVKDRFVKLPPKKEDLLSQADRLRREADQLEQIAKEE